MKTESETLLEAAQHIRDLCDKQWQGSKGYHSGMVGAAVILDKMAKDKQLEQTK